MARLNVPYIRIMSYPNDPKSPLTEPEWRAEAIKRMRVLTMLAEDAGIILVHENCSGWGGLYAKTATYCTARSTAGALKVVFDTGNPVTYGQNTWDYYEAVKKDIVYVHIKDAKKIDGEDHYTYCGDGEGYVREVVGDLLKNGYAGGISIEPHLGHDRPYGQEAFSPKTLLRQLHRIQPPHDEDCRGSQRLSTDTSLLHAPRAPAVRGALLSARLPPPRGNSNPSARILTLRSMSSPATATIPAPAGPKHPVRIFLIANLVYVWAVHVWGLWIPALGRDFTAMDQPERLRAERLGLCRHAARV